jgi:hypothetical protein
MLIQPREYLVVTSPFVNLLVLVSWFCIVGSYLTGCVLLFCECAVWTDGLSCGSFGPQVAGCCEFGNEPSGTIKRGEFLD